MIRSRRHVRETNRIASTYRNLETVDSRGRTLIVDWGQLHVLPSHGTVDDGKVVIGVAIFFVALAYWINVGPIPYVGVCLVAAFQLLRVLDRSRPGTYLDEMEIRIALWKASEGL